MTLGERLAQLRTQAGLSQDDLAERLDVSRQSVSKWETGASVPGLDNLVKLSRLFGVPLDELVQGRPSPLTWASRLWRRAAALYRERGYLLGWALAAWGVWDLLRCVWNCLVVLPVLGIWEALYLLFAGMLTAYIPGFLKIILGAELVLRGKRLTGHLRWYHLAWGLVAVGAFGFRRITALRDGLVPLVLTLLTAAPTISSGSEWQLALSLMLRGTENCLLLLVLGFAILVWGHHRRVSAESNP